LVRSIAAVTGTGTGTGGGGSGGARDGWRRDGRRIGGIGRSTSIRACGMIGVLFRRRIRGAGVCPCGVGVVRSNGRVID